MSMEIKGDAPLTEAERRYLQDRGRHEEIARIDEQHPPENKADLDGVPGVDWTPASGLETVSTQDLLDELDRRHTAGENVWGSPDESADVEVGPGKVTTPDYDNQTVQDLQQELARRGLSTTGKKAELADRLRASDAESYRPNPL